jgi:hypothetical protein
MVSLQFHLQKIFSNIFLALESAYMKAQTFKAKTIGPMKNIIIAKTFLESSEKNLFLGKLQKSAFF